MVSLSIQKRAKLLIEKAKIAKSFHSDELIELREKCEANFFEFIKYFWPYGGSDEDYLHNWHIPALAEHLQACYTGDIRYLIINVPPRTGKTIVGSIMFPAWVWANNPRKRFIYTSYAESLATTGGNFCRLLLNCYPYQQLWGQKVKLIQETAHAVYNDKGGCRIAAGINGAVTGHGAWAIVADDPNSLLDSHAKTVLERTSNIWDTVFASRLNNRKTGVRILIQQRTSVLDMTGHILARDLPDVVHLYLPMRYEADNKCKTILLPNTKKIWEDPRTIDGEVLVENRFPQEEVDKMEKDMGNSYAWAGQYQQRPSPKSGGLLKPEWFQWWCKAYMPSCKIIIQSWDTALTAKKNSAYSACTTWGLFEDDNKISHLILISMWRGKLEYPELRIMAQRLYNDFLDTKPNRPTEIKNRRPDMVIIEERVNGYTLIQDFQRAGIPVIPFQPKRKGIADSDKESRASLVAHLIEGGRVWVRARGPDFEYLHDFSDEFLDLCSMFPSDEANDVVDTMTQVLLKALDMRWLENPKDPEFVQYDLQGRPEEKFY